MEELDLALRKNDERKIMEMLPKYNEMRKRLDVLDANPPSAYSPTETKLLEEAYKVPANPKLKGSGTIDEKSASNTELRSRISRKYGNVTDNELDRVIDKMSDEELFNMLGEGDSYGEEDQQHIMEHPEERDAILKAIRNVMKYVGLLTGVIVGKLAVKE